MTPRYFFTLLERLKALDRPKGYTLELMIGQLIAMVGNTSMAGFKEPLKPIDFMPSEYAKRQTKPKAAKRRSRAEIATEVRETMRRWMKKGA